MKQDLLTYIFEKSKMTYLSDLKFIKKEEIVSILEEINTDDFSINEWKELYLYLMQEDTVEKNSEDIKRSLLK